MFNTDFLSLLIYGIVFANSITIKSLTILVYSPSEFDLNTIINELYFYFFRYLFVKRHLLVSEWKWTPLNVQWFMEEDDGTSTFV
jgi:hypothetical protein